MRSAVWALTALLLLAEGAGAQTARTKGRAGGGASVQARAKEIAGRCEERVAAVISRFNIKKKGLACYVRENRKSDWQRLAPEEAGRRQLRANQELYCDEDCSVVILLCGDRSEYVFSKNPPSRFKVPSPYESPAYEPPFNRKGRKAQLFTPADPEPRLLPQAVRQTRGYIRTYNPPEIGVPIDPWKPAVAPTPKTVMAAGDPDKKIEVRPSNETDWEAALGVEGAEESERRYMSALYAGNLSRRAGDYKAAAAAYRRAIELRADWRAAYGLGNVYAHQGRWDEAEESYRRAAQLDPSDMQVRLALGYVLLMREDGVSAEKQAEGEAMLMSAGRLPRLDGPALRILTEARMRRGARADELEAMYRRFLSVSPQSAWAHWRLSRLLRESGRTEEGEKHFKRAVEQERDAGPLVEAAEALEAEGEYRKSEQLVRRALEIDPMHPRALYLYGRALMVRKQHGRALSMLSLAAAADPGDFATRYLLGLLLLRENRTADAESEFNRAAALLAAGAGDPLALAYGFVGLGDAYAKAGRPADAARVYKLALQYDPEDADAKLKLSEVSAGREP